ncbi:MAG: Gfo/Idh/MocA family oxidoreductase [Acidobacteriota bacterium]|nr:Gfo/Idh/MocA family oxidoreductase [Acidobacteriota bacterium]
MKRHQVSRRRALGGLAALATVPINTSRIRAGSEEPISAGVLTEGTGGGHIRQLLQGLASAPGVARVAVSDPTGKRFDQAKDLLGDRLQGLYHSHQKMLRKVRPKLVVVILAGHRSPPAIRMALEAGSHVITEKPGCARLEDFEPLAPLAQSQKRELMLAMHTRMSHAIQKARELIRKGYLGKPYSATMDWIADQTRLTRPEFHGLWVASKAKAGGGKLIYHGIHYLDVLQYLTGDRIDRISAFCENVGGQPIDVEDAAVVTFRMRGGWVGTLNAGYYLDRSKQNQIRFWGSKGWMHLELTSGEPLKWYSTHPDAPRGVQLFHYQDNSNHRYGSLVHAAVDFARGQAPPPMTAEESLHLMRVIFAGYRSAETGRTQDLG